MIAATMNTKSTRQRQDGVILLGAIALIVIIGLLGVVLAAMIATNLRAGTEQYDGFRAFYVAESGLEKGIREWSLNAAYPGEIATVFDVGTFDITPSVFDYDGVSALPAGQRRLISTGQVGNAIRTVEAIAMSPTANILANEHFDNGPPPPPGPDNWTITADASDTTNGYDPVGGAGGSAAVTVQKTIKGGPITTTAVQTLTTPLPVSVASTFTIDYVYQVVGSGRIDITLIDSSGGRYKFPKTNVNDTGGGWVTETDTITVAAGVTLVDVEIVLTGKGKPLRQVWIDDLFLSGGSLQRVSWRENFH